MSAIEFARDRANEFAQNIYGAVTQEGRLALHTLFPDEFEYYLIAFEVVDGTKITDRLILPVMPDRIAINQNKIINVKKTAAGIVSYMNDSFVPVNITISGTLGRRLRLLLGNKQTKGIDEPTQGDFVPNVKTGYGATKLLQRIFDKSTQTNKAGKPYRIHFYNLAYNKNYLIQFRSFDLSQDPEHNMYWQYNITMTAIAPAEIAKFKSETTLFGHISVINQLIDNTIQDAKLLV